MELQEVVKLMDHVVQIKDFQTPNLYNSLGIDTTGKPSSRPVSGAMSFDYPIAIERGLIPPNVFELEHHAEIPVELNELLNQPDVKSCRLGIFANINRAWMILDSDVYFWDYRNGGDLSFYDGSKEPIISMALVPVKQNVFQTPLKYVLVIVTTSEISLLGFVHNEPRGSSKPGYELVTNPIFEISTEGSIFHVIAGTEQGRILLGGADGTIHEIDYQTSRGWFHDRCWKTNLSRSFVSTIVPSTFSKLFAPTGSDPIIQIVIDDVRQLMFARTVGGAIKAFDLGINGTSFRQIGGLDLFSIAKNCLAISKNTLEPGAFKKILAIGIIDHGEMNLVAMTDMGIRIYFSCALNPAQYINDRPSGFNVAHIRFPPGYCPSTALKKPSQAQFAFYSEEIFALSSPINNESESLWLISPFPYPTKIYAELSTVHILKGLTLDIQMVKTKSKGIDTKLPHLHDSVTQHLNWQKRIVVMTANGTAVYRLAKPYELLKDLLKAGPEKEEAIKGHFEMAEIREHPLVNALVIATHPGIYADQSLFDISTRAFFLYGDQNKPTQQQATNYIGTSSPYNIPAANTSGFNTSGLDQTLFNPVSVSTPNKDTFGRPQPQHMSPIYMETGFNSFHQPSQPTSPLAGVRDQQQPFASQYGTTFPASPDQIQQVQSNLGYSSRHDALYLYTGRVLITFWSRPLVKFGTVKNPEPIKVIVPNISGVEVTYAAAFLQGLERFLSDNPSLYVIRKSPVGQTMNKTSFPHGDQEKHSIASLKNFIKSTLEVLNMWKILCDHQFHIVIGGLDERLKQLSFKELVVTPSGQTLVSTIINSLINKYLGDNAAIDAISLKLRESCPNLFKNEDAIGSKVAELLSKAKTSLDERMKEALLKESLTLCEGICGHGRINVKGFCRQYADLGFPYGAVRLCLLSAKAADPDQLAINSIRTSSSGGTTPAVSSAIQAYQARAEVYKIVFDILDSYVSISVSRQSPIVRKSLPSSGENEDPTSILRSEAAKEYADQTVRAILSSDDEAFHVSLYNWLLERKLFDRLLDIKHPFLDAFLQRAADAVVTGKWPTDGSTNDTRVLDLLWRHHEMNQNHLAAAQILSKLAESTTTGLNLQQRIEYLSRAIVAAKCVYRRGEILETLEDKLEVVQIQKSVLDSISAKLHSVAISASGEEQTSSAEYKVYQDAVMKLNCQLMNITSLYSEYTLPFKLHEARLEIFHTAGHNDKALIETLWADIIEAELKMSSRQSMEAQMEVIRRKLVNLGRKYSSSPIFFPIEYLVEHLESMKPNENVDPGWVFKTMLEVGIHFTDLLYVYEKLWRKLGSTESTGSGSDLGIAQVIIMMVNMFTNQDMMTCNSQFISRPELIEKCNGIVSAMIVEFSSRFDPASTQMKNSLIEIKDRLDQHGS